jgi:hypothetical protein
MSYWAQTLYAILKRFILPTMYFNQIIRSFILTTMYFDQIIFAFILNQKLWFLFSKKKCNFYFWWNVTVFKFCCKQNESLESWYEMKFGTKTNQIWTKFHHFSNVQLLLVTFINKSNLNNIFNYYFF